MINLRFTLLLIALCCAGHIHAGFTIQDGRIMHTDDVATMSAEGHYNCGVIAYQDEDFHEAARQFRILIMNYPKSSLQPDSCFWLGVSYFQQGELDFANNAFNAYLKAHTNPKYFEETIRYKFDIATRFRCGEKKRLFGTKQLPKWGPSGMLAMEIYDEIIASVPCHDLAAQALYAKAFMLWQDRCFRESIDILVQLIRRFPRHELAPESYLAITAIYLEESQIEYQNPDLLGLAEINVRRFQNEFPGDPRVPQAEANLQSINETYAYGLYSTGQFYERKRKINAAVIYYQRATALFPDTNIALLCYKRLNCLRELYFVKATPIATESGEDA